MSTHNNFYITRYTDEQGLARVKAERWSTKSDLAENYRGNACKVTAIYTWDDIKLANAIADNNDWYSALVKYQDGMITKLVYELAQTNREGDLAYYIEREYMADYEPTTEEQELLEQRKERAGLKK